MITKTTLVGFLVRVIVEYNAILGGFFVIEL